MTAWDANLQELRAACAAAGERPLDDAHVMTCAVRLIERLTAEAEEAIPSDEHSKALDEADERLTEEQRAHALTEEALEDARRHSANLERDLARARADLDALRAALGGDASAQVVALAEAQREAAEARALLRDRCREFADHARRWAAALGAPRAKKEPVLARMRAVAADLVRGLDDDEDEAS